ncbi:hypothetical protein [Priestia megaterium]|uniref:hypothetical protein n=1 Tax=Priestia megaterium TaxID=1404 RepID=UPI0021F3D1D7|nr:hypothetical protein [Priestia megaterium]UYP09795.1 hypothetical protein OIJ04_09380 [Priestia megaterium]
MWLFSVTIASIIIWSAVVKSLKKKHKGKIMTLMSASTLSGFILTVSLFQSIRFLKTRLSKLAIQQAASRKWMVRYKKSSGCKNHAAFSYLYTPK